MPEFEISALAEEDLIGIARYTIEQWDAEQAVRYADFFDAHFRLIASGEAQTRAPIKTRPELLASRCKKHVVFHLDRGAKCPLIIAILHERMDLMTRLVSRLGFED